MIPKYSNNVGLIEVDNEIQIFLPNKNKNPITSESLNFDKVVHKLTGATTNLNENLKKYYNSL